MLESPSNHQLLSFESRLGAVHIAVTNADRARDFWTNTLGLTELESNNDTIRLGAGTQKLVVLHPNAIGSVEPRRTGLYHLAIHFPNPKEFARAVARLFQLRYPNSPTDHTMTETTYLSDPDGNGIELTLETPERGKTIWLPNGQPTMQTSDGRIVSPVERLDVAPLFAVLDSSDDLQQAVPVGTRIGHVHLHVRDKNAATSFYRDLIGFRVLMEIPQMGMVDFGLEESSVPHTLAINAWHGAHAPIPSANTSGLRFFTLQVSQTDLVGVITRLEQANWTFKTLERGIAVRDPSENALRILV